MTNTFKNLDAIPTKTIRSILDDAPYYRGARGADYSDHVAELTAILHERQLKEAERQEQQRRREERRAFRAMAQAHKRHVLPTRATATTPATPALEGVGFTIEAPF